MNEIRELIRKFIDDRDSLSEEELERLVDYLRAQPDLAAKLKDHLTVDDMLAQTFDLTRWHFLAQVDQRLRDESRGFSGLLPAFFESNEEMEAVRQRRQDSASNARKTYAVTGEPVPSDRTAPAKPRGKKRAIWPWTVLALSLIAAVGIAFAAFVMRDDRPAVAKLEVIEGDVRVIRQNRENKLREASGLYPGDRLLSSPNSAASIRYPDGTMVSIDAETSIALAHGHSAGTQKRVMIERGRLSADVAPQPSGLPMIFTSPDAQAEVLGTKLTLFLEGRETHLKVAVGRVRLTRSSDRKSVVVSQNEIGVSGPYTLAKAPSSWPSNREGLIFLFETNDRPNQVRSTTSGMNRSYTVRPRGRAHLNHDGAMVLTKGAFLANDVDGEILAACRQTNQLSVEATISPSKENQTGPARIVTFSTDVNQRDFTLGQEGDKLIVRIRTPQTGRNGVGNTETGIPVAGLVPGAPNHIIVSYQPGRLVCYLNGKQVYESDQIQGDFRDWSAQHLLFGDEYGGRRDWAGTLEGVAIYNRFIGPEEAASNALQYDDRRHSRPRVPQIRVRARLAAKSAIPTSQAILPHRSALVVYKYHVEKVLDGQTEGPDLFVAHWAVLDGKEQPVSRLDVGTVRELHLEPYEQNPQVKHYFCSDDFGAVNEKPGQRYLEVQQ